MKNWCFWTVVLEKTLESPLDCKEIEPVYPKGDQSWVFIGRTDAEAETPILWPLHEKSWLIGKDPDSGTDWGQEEKGVTDDEMAGWHRVRLFATPWTIRPWNSLGQNTGVDSHSLLQRIFLTQGSNPCLPRCRRILYHLSHQGSPSDAKRKQCTRRAFFNC